MGQFFTMIGNFWRSIFNLFDAYPITIYGYEVSLTGILFAFFVAGLVITVFWKGART